MSDVIFIAVLLAFFLLCALYVQLCDRMIGPDTDHANLVDESPDLTTASVGTEDAVNA